MYLQGRCLNLYAPTDIITDYNFSEALPAPEEQLRLEWVYVTYIYTATSYFRTHFHKSSLIHW